MKPFTFIISFVLIALISLSGVLLYLKYEKPAHEGYDFVNVSIYAFEGEIPIEVGYEIYFIDKNLLYKEGKTTKFGAIFHEIPQNNTFLIRNINLEGQNYYPLEYEFQTNEIKPYRVNLDLKEVGNLTVEQWGSLGDNILIRLNVTSIGYFDSKSFCMRWSTRIITAKVNSSYNQIIPRKGYNKCYENNLLLYNSGFRVKFDYLSFNDITNKDYIDIFFFDSINNSIKHRIQKS